ncbi:MAG: citrate (Si)-synthase [Gammaproteobacteria bacterium RIFCSPHIGHO2_12_FULL_35_23]|nr:MAG: citrate (Si)-synthase [Gammaproteobacteria bacterium RIFCSPHIGHO2_12_FULL_35_23]
MNDDKALLNFNNASVELPIHRPTLGQDVIEVSSLGKSGAFTYDPGFMATAACESKITFIDGGKGVLLYRGYPIDQLAEKSDFMEVCYLILNGELPTQAGKTAFEKKVNDHMAVDPIIENIFKGFKKEAHPMAMITAAIASLAGLYHDQTNIKNSSDRMDAAIKFVAKIPTLTAMCYRHGKGETFLSPRKDLTYSENFIYMMYGKASDTDKPNPVLCKAMDTIFVLHADHEQNASTSTVRLSGSTDTDPFAAFAAGATALWGPAHGGANEAALNMLHEIASVDRIPHYIARAKDKSDSFRLMGFGHRVYKNYDPRASVMRKICYDVLEETGSHELEVFKVAKALEKIALEDAYFLERKLYPNVDFYSGITQSALGIPSRLFTVIFTLGRSVGWAAHWNEMLSNAYKIGRPRQLYTGYTKRDFVAIDER